MGHNTHYEDRVHKMIKIVAAISFVMSGCVPDQQRVLPTLRSLPSSPTAASPTATSSLSTFTEPLVPVRASDASEQLDSSRLTSTFTQASSATASPAAWEEPEQLIAPRSIAVSSDPLPNQVVIRFAPSTTRAQRAAYIQQTGAEINEEIASLHAIVVTIPATSDAKDLPPSPIVVSSEPDYHVTALSANDPLLPQQWALPVIGVTDAWSVLDSDTEPVIVAVVDSGTCADHPDLRDRILDGWDFVENDPFPQDEFGHGCAVAGIIAANTNNGTGIAGVAANTKIMPLRVLNSQGIGTYSNVAAAIVYAVDHQAQIINLSLGGSNSSALLKEAIDYAIERNVLVIAAAGNTGSTVLYPAAYDSVIAVASVDPDLHMSSFSSRGPEIDTLAPGRNILVLSNNGDYTYASGSSFAAPHVTGVAAIEFAFERSLVLNGGVVTLGDMVHNQSSTEQPLATQLAQVPTASGLFLDTQSEEATRMANQRGVIRSRLVEINFNAIPQSGLTAAQSVETIYFNLFEDTGWIGRIARTEPSSTNSDGYIWVGQLQDYDYGLAILVVNGGQIQGYVENLNARYHITYFGDGLHVVNQIDPSAFDFDHADVATVETGLYNFTGSATVDALTNLWIVDVTVIYTTDARIAEGSTTAIENSIQLAVAYTNQAYINSGANLRLRLVHMQEVAYSSSGNVFTDLDQLTALNDGHLDLVHTIRDNTSADLVTLIVPVGQYCGVAWLSVYNGQGNPYLGFSVIARGCLGYSATFAHEIGHNLGAQHDKPSATSLGAYNYSYGYTDPDGMFRDIMSYANCPRPCPQINYFSSATQTIGGRPLGKADADNVRTFNNTAPIVAAYRNSSLFSVTATPTPAIPSITPSAPTPTPTALPSCNHWVADGNTSQLVNAINLANSNGPGTDVICLSSGSIYAFSSAYEMYDGAIALPVITSSITILGDGATITRNSSDEFRFFLIESSGSLRLDNITLDNGRCLFTSGCWEGGAIASLGNLVITDSTLMGNLAEYGGAIAALYKNITIVNTVFWGNSAYAGGAIYKWNSSFTIDRSLFAENSAVSGGAIFVDGPGNTDLIDSCFIRNSNLSIFKVDYAPAINAINNWWGASTGPSLNTIGGQSGGDTLPPSGINYIPFLQSIPSYCAPAPTTSGPNGSTTINPPTFTWNTALGAIGYELQYGDTNPPGITVSEMNTTYTPPLPLLTKTYYWRVRSILSGGGYSGWSSLQTVRIEDIANASPRRNFYKTATPRLTWAWISWAKQLELQVSTDPSFTTSIEHAANVPGNVLEMTLPSLVDGVYYWRIRAQRPDGTWSAWSEVDSFTIDAP